MNTIPAGYIQQPDGSYSKPSRLKPLTALEKAFNAEVEKHFGKQVQVATHSQPKRIRQNPKPIMNKLEQSWFEQLRVFSYNGESASHLRAQSIRFKLGNGIWFKPDITCVIGGQSTAFEVKGPHAFRGGFENLKVAAGLYREWKFVLVWKEHGEWKEQIVLP